MVIRRSAVPIQIISLLWKILLIDGTSPVLSAKQEFYLPLRQVFFSAP
jgi:hypothetical protein